MNDFDDLADLITTYRLRHENVPAEAVPELSREVSQVIQEKFCKPHLPSATETVAVAMSSPKTAALMYDRVWSMPNIDSAPPDAVRVYGATPLEVWALSLFALAPGFPWDVIGFKFPGSPIASWGARPAAPARSIAEALAAHHGIAATPIYSDEAALREEYTPGKVPVVVAAIEQLQIVNEDELSWDQVLEFRADSDARAAYRRLVHWLDTDLVGRSGSFISDEIEMRLERYEEALRRHGILAVVGAAESLFDASFVAAAATAFASVAVTTTVSAGALTTLAVAGGKVVCSIARQLLDAQETKRSEIAYVYEARRVGGGRKTNSRATDTREPR